MLKYAKVMNEETGICQIGDGTNYKFYQSIGFKLLDVSQSDIDNGWYVSDKCPMKTDRQKEIEEIEKQIEQINEELNNLDTKRIRAICEPSIKDEETGETWFDYYNSQIVNLRQQIQELKERMKDNDIIE